LSTHVKDMASARSPLYLTLERSPGNIYIITLSRKAENKLNGAFCQELIRAFHTIHRELGSSSEGAVITRGSNEKFWCMGIDLEDADPWTNSDGFYPVRSQYHPEVGFELADAYQAHFHDPRLSLSYHCLVDRSYFRSGLSLSLGS
jgi:enoyl-CoA hydratase/carnithine racemase